MSYEQKDGSGVLFKNDRKQSEKHPDYRGTITINGEQLELAAWIKDGRNGKFMSLSAKAKQERAAPPKRDDDPVPQDFNDNIPF